MGSGKRKRRRRQKKECKGVVDEKSKSNEKEPENREGRRGGVERGIETKLSFDK